jgi:predicted dehydrogenase
MIKAGVIGVGHLGQHHARILSGLEGVTLTAVVDSDRKRAEEIAAKFGGTVFASHKDALAMADVFSVAAPTTFHHSIALDCIRAGKHLLIEKPIAATVKEADDIIEESQNHDVIVQIGHIERFNPAVQAVFPLIKKPVFFEAERLSPFFGRGTDVDINVDLMIHDIEIVLAFLSRGGEIPMLKDIKVAAESVLTDKIDIARVWFEFTSGVNALMTASRIAMDKSRTLKIFEGDTYYIVDYQNSEIKRCFKKDGGMAVEQIPVEKHEPLKAEISDFIDCVIKGRRPLVSAHEGRNALKIAIEISRRIAKDKK